jgi:hypothetical protein
MDSPVVRVVIMAGAYYRRYVDDIIIIFDQNKTDEHTITNHMNSIHTCRYLELKLTTEENNNVSYVDLLIHRDNHGLRIGIYRKPMQTDTTIHFTSNHPLERKLATYNFYINRMLSMPITIQARQQEWDTICTIARKNGFPLRIIHNLRITKIRKTDNNSTNTPKKIWVTFTYNSPLVHKVTHLFKHTNINIAFRKSNTTYTRQNTTKQNQLQWNIYRVIRNDCRGFNNLSYTIHFR